MSLRIVFLVSALTILSSSCGDDKGGASESSATSGGTTGGSTSSQSTSTDGSATDGSTTGGSTTGGDTSSPTSGDTGGGIKEDCDASTALIAQSDMYTCTCEVEKGGFPDVETCMAFFGHVPEEQAKMACACEQTATDPSNAGVEACRRDAWETFLACITPLMCSEDDAFSVCFNALLDSSCGDASDQSLAQILLQCEGSKPYMCGSGETIPEEWTCDDQSDCMDGSDEKNC